MLTLGLLQAETEFTCREASWFSNVTWLPCTSSSPAPAKQPRCTASDAVPDPAADGMMGGDDLLSSSCHAAVWSWASVLTPLWKPGRSLLLSGFTLMWSSASQLVLEQLAVLQAVTCEALWIPVDMQKMPHAWLLRA